MASAYKLAGPNGWHLIQKNKALLNTMPKGHSKALRKTYQHTISLKNDHANNKRFIRYANYP